MLGLFGDVARDLTINLTMSRPGPSRSIVWSGIFGSGIHGG